MKRKVLNLAVIMVIPAALLAFIPCSSTAKSQTAAPESMQGGVVVDAALSFATVQSVNASNRTMRFGTRTAICSPMSAGRT